MTRTSTVLFDDDDVQLVYFDGKNRDTLVITFSSLGMFKPGGGSIADGHTFWGRAFIEKSAFSAIGFVAKRPHWFMNPGMSHAAAAARAISASYRSVVSYGSSMGGFASLRYSRELGCTSVIACGPQGTLDNDALPRPDHRYQHHFRPSDHRGMCISEKDVCKFSYIIYDPFCALDRMHAEHIKSLAPQVIFVPAYFAGHECVRVIGHTEAAITAIGLSAAHDLAGLMALIRTLCRRAPVRALELALIAMDRKPALSRAIFAKHESRLDQGQRNLFQATLEARVVKL